MQKCRELGDACVGFIRTENDGKCFFRGVSLRAPRSAAGRACFRPNVLFPIQPTTAAPEPTTAAPVASAVGDPHIQTIHDKKFDLEGEEPSLIQESEVVSDELEPEMPTADFEKLDGMDCQGGGGDILRGFRGNDAECMQKCRELGDACVGFIRTEQDGKCFFRGVSLREPRSAAGRSCFRPNALFPIQTPEPDFEKLDGMDCQGTGGDVLRGFRGNDAECMAKCRELSDACVGFIRLDDGRCYFRGGNLRPATNSAGRACFRPNALFPILTPEPDFEKMEGMDCQGTGGDVLRGFRGNDAECMAKCRELSDVCVGFIRLDDGRCYFRGVSLRTPTNSPGRACFRPNELFPIQPTTAAPDAASAVGDPHIQTIRENKFDLDLE